MSAPAIVAALMLVALCGAWCLARAAANADRSAAELPRPSLSLVREDDAE